jgi:tRNA (guanine-N7-)-methyltransferase
MINNDDPSFIPLRKVKSFVRRAGRMSASQKQGMEQGWARWGLELQPTYYDLEAVMERTAPTTLEIGFGMGASLLALARAHPEENFIGIEVHEAGVGKVLQEIAAHQLTNIRLFQKDAVEVLTQCIPPHSLDRVLLFFPDPWPKKRHHKRRLVQPAFMELLAQKLKVGGLFHVATDWQDYATHVQEVLRSCPQFEPCPPEYPFERPSSKYEQRGLQLGHGIWDLGFILIKK